MSRRQLRKVEALRANQKVQQEESEKQLSEEDEPDSPVMERRARNRFDLLLDSDDDDDDNDDDEGGEEADGEGETATPTHPSEGEVAPSVQQQEPSTKKKKKKKKRKKKKQLRPDGTDASEDLDLNDDDAVNAFLKGTTDKTSAAPGQSLSSKSTKTQPCSLLSVAYSYFDADSELQKMFGSDVVSRVNTARGVKKPIGRRFVAPGYGRKGNAGNVGNKGSITGMQRYIPRYDNGMTMVVDESFNNSPGDHTTERTVASPSSALTVFRYEHDKSYQKHQFMFDYSLALNDQQGIVDLLRTRPHHIDCQLQLAGFFRAQEDYSHADNLTRRAINEFEDTMHNQFRITDTNSVLDYNRMENRGLFVAMFYHMVSVAKRRCFRAALELCKVLMRLSAHGDDPLAAMLLVDQFCLRSHEFFWFVEYFNSRPDLNLAMMPNFAYSVPLAYFFLSRGNGYINAHKSLKVQLTDAQANMSREEMRAQADATLAQGLTHFPELLLRLAAENSITLNPAIVSHPLFNTATLPSALDLLYQLYILRVGHYWKEPEVVAWFKGVALSVVKQASTPSRAQRPAFACLPRPMQRHVLLEDLPTLLPLLPQATVALNPLHFHDPVPPPNSERSYATPQHETIQTQRSWLADFFGTFIPQGEEQARMDMVRQQMDGMGVHIQDQGAAAAADVHGGIHVVGAGNSATTGNPVMIAVGGAIDAVGGAIGALGGAIGAVGGSNVPEGGAVGQEGGAVGGAASGTNEAQTRPAQSFRFLLDSARALLDSAIFRGREGEEGEQWLGEGEESEGDEDSDFNEDQNNI